MAADLFPESPMPIIRMRVTADDDATLILTHALESIEGIERVEEIEDLMPHMDDDDSSSAGLDEDAPPGFSVIELHAPNHQRVPPAASSRPSPRKTTRCDGNAPSQAAGRRGVDAPREP